MKSAVVLLSLLLAVASAQNLRASSNMLTVSAEHPCKYDASHKHELYVLQSPLLFETYGTLFETMDIYHTAIALKDVETGNECTLEYAALDFILANFPALNETEGCPLDKKISWKGEAKIFVNDDKIAGYWTKRDLMTTVEGDLIAKIFQFANEFVVRNPNYYVASVVDEHVKTTFIPSANCFDFIDEALQFVGKSGSKWVSSAATVKRNFVYIYAERPTDVRLEDAKYTEEIIKFYRIFKYDYSHDGFKGLLERVMLLLKVLYLPKSNTEFHRFHGVGTIFGYTYEPFKLV
eukprot:GILI01021605.1.p2 GENE.GILI01021605.1~~GILI01021605.1.p2  ORF type:complete len:292 (-),score=103.98 GILI01021605.1:40-915(-)